MDKKNANGFSLKASETGGQRKQLPYSVETPYGFHLDLDFLKYVDDIEKGNTIKRVHIQRRNKNPKFSTLPRNFSLPGHGSRTVPKDNRASTYTLGSKVKSRVVEVQQIYEFRPPDGGSVCYPRASGVAFKSIKAVEDATLQAFDEQPLGLHVRPHLLRASSMPVTVLRKNSEYMDIQGHKGSVGSYRENGSSENFFCSSDVVDRRANLPGEHPGLHQQFSTALQKIRELEEQVKTIPELKAQISALEEEKQQLLLRLNSQAIASRGNTRLQGELERTEHQDPRDARASNSKDAKPGPEHSVSFAFLNEAVCQCLAQDLESEEQEESEKPSEQFWAQEKTCQISIKETEKTEEMADMTLRAAELDGSVEIPLAHNAVVEGLLKIDLNNCLQEARKEVETMESHSSHQLTARGTYNGNMQEQVDKRGTCTSEQKTAPLHMPVENPSTRNGSRQMKTPEFAGQHETVHDTLVQDGVDKNEGDLDPTHQGTDKLLENTNIQVLQVKLNTAVKQFTDVKKQLDNTITLLSKEIEENKLKEETIKQLNEKLILYVQEARTVQSSAYVETYSVSVQASVQQPALSDKAVSTEDKSLPGTCNGRQQNEMISSSTQTVNVEAQNRGISSNFLTVEVCVAAEVITCDRAVETDPQELPCSSAKKNAGMAEESENAIGSVKLEKAVSLPVEGANCMVELRHHQQDDQKQLPYRDGEEPVVMHAAISQYVTKIQGLLNEQWACLGSGYPEIASTLKQPASKFSSIQTQLVSSLNALSSFCSSPGQKGGATRQAALKSIMKKNDCSKRAGNGGTKKNLKFVGVNGGYETTSSEESSAEDNVEEDSSESEERGEGGDRPAQDLTHTQSQAVKAQPAESRTTEAAEDPPSPSCEVGHQKEQLDRETVDEDFVAACLFLKDRLEEVASPDKEMRQVLMVLYQEWFRVSSQEDSHVDTVTLCLKEVAAAAPTLLCFLVNLADGNGNTALHYSVSHSNFSIVKLLLDTGLCDVDHQNKAGYTAIMLASLTTADSPEDMEVALQLLQQGNVNAQASQAGQTALMLAVSHGRTAMVRLLLDCQADVNVQDHDGSTALMCACENGHTDIVRLLLERDCDLNVMDKEGHTALSVALQASHSDVVDLLKANMDATASKPHEPL
ncbi:KN motif and ankyrin repeat domain-containing protein 4 [Arapaima gigas]